MPIFACWSFPLEIKASNSATAERQPYSGSQELLWECSLYSASGRGGRTHRMIATSALRQSRTDRANSRSGHVRHAPKAELKSEHKSRHDESLRLICCRERDSSYSAKAILLKRNQCGSTGPVPSAKIFLFSPDPNHLFVSGRPAPSEGRFAIVTDVERDAVDADRAGDERRVRRTAKSCGPDAPTLASSSQEARFLRATVANKPGHRGEHEVNRKTIARGMPGVFRCDRGDLLACFLPLHARLRAHRAPGIPCALP